MNTYETSNLRLAAFLLTRNVKLLKIEFRVYKCFMVFEDSDNQIANKLSDEYWNGGTVSAKVYCENYRDLKTRIIQTKEQIKSQGM
jgi:Domain of unknown function (DUF5659)